jgi:hypothetical protein
MSKAQLVITAVVLEGRSKSEVARDYDVSRCWVQQLVKRYHAEEPAAFEPRSRRPHHHLRTVDSGRQLLGDGDVELGTMLHHPDVPVALRSAEFSKHLAVLGMTGSGKSNAIKVLLHRLSNGPLREALRVVVIDTHGEYAPVAQMISSSARIIDVRLRRSVLDEEVVHDLLRLSRRNEALLDKQATVADGLSPEQNLEEFLAAVEVEAPNASTLTDKLTRLVAAAREADDLCLWLHDSAMITRADSDDPQRLDEPGLYILNLRQTASMKERSAKAAAVMTDVFERSKQTGGEFPSLLVLDEAQNYAPEQQTGWLKRGRTSFDAAFAIASEGRKFGVGLVVSSQRPARVNKDVLSQCNTHLVFRVANVEDLSALAGSFEAASQPLLAELPGFDTGSALLAAPRSACSPASRCPCSKVLPWRMADR